VGLTLKAIVKEAFVPAVLVNVIPAVFLYCAVNVHTPDSLSWLVLEGGLFGLLSLICFAIGVLDFRVFLRDKVAALRASKTVLMRESDER
jgi:hypothetical protein